MAKFVLKNVPADSVSVSVKEGEDGPGLLSDWAKLAGNGTTDVYVTDEASHGEQVKVYLDLSGAADPANWDAQGGYKPQCLRVQCDADSKEAAAEEFADVFRRFPTDQIVSPEGGPLLIRVHVPVIAGGSPENWEQV